MEKKTTKKVLKLSSETLRELENKRASIGGGEGTGDSIPFCCP